MKTRITLLAQPKSMRSIIDATQREQRHGLACNWGLSKGGVPSGPATANLTPHPAPVAAFSEPEWSRGVNRAGFKVAKWGMYPRQEGLQNCPTHLKNFNLTRPAQRIILHWPACASLQFACRGQGDVHCQCIASSHSQ